MRLEEYKREKLQLFFFKAHKKKIIYENRKIRKGNENGEKEEK